jgi:hypothetical protein
MSGESGLDGRVSKKKKRRLESSERIIHEAGVPAPYTFHVRETAVY